MELTGKAKEALQAYFKGSDDFYNTSVEEFQNYPESMQYGVLVDFFDSVGIGVESNISSMNPFKFKAFLNGYYISEHNTRPEARIAEIKQANEIFNNRQ